MHEFQESHSAFSGFSEFYHREIYPQLAAWEGKRKFKRFWAVPLLLISSAMSALCLYWGFKTPHELVTYIAAGLAFFLNPVFAYRWHFKGFKTDVKNFLVTKVCNFTGLTYSKEANTSPPMSLFRDFGFFPRSYRFAKSEDHMNGFFQGVSFQVVEVHGETGNNNAPQKHVTTIFKFNLPNFSEGDLVVLRKGDRKPAKQLNYKPIGFAAPPFSHFFDVYGADQVISRYLLHPVFLERILHAERAMDGINARFAFADQTLWICVETANRFEQGSMWASFLNPKRTQFLIWEVSSVLNIVDGLVDLLRQPGRATQHRH